MEKVISANASFASSHLIKASAPITIANGFGFKNTGIFLIWVWEYEN